MAVVRDALHDDILYLDAKMLDLDQDSSCPEDPWCTSTQIEHSMLINLLASVDVNSTNVTALAVSLMDDPRLIL